MIGGRFAIAAAGGTLALALAAGLGTLHVAGRATPLDALEAVSFDLRLLAAGPLPASDSVVVVAIDEPAISALGAVYPLPRDALAAIVERVAAASPRALALDVVLAAETENDPPLVAALGKVPATIAAAATFGPDTARLPMAEDVIRPANRFAAVAAPAIVNLSLSATGTPQHLPAITLTATGIASHIVVRGAALFLGAEPQIADDTLTIGPATARLDTSSNLPLRIAGPTGTLATVSAADLLAGRGGEAIAGRLAFVGFTAAAVGDSFATPFDAVTPGVEVLAGAAASLIDGTTLDRSTGVRIADAVGAGALGLAAAMLVTFAPLALGLSAAVGLIAATLVAAVLLFAAGIWISVALPLAVALPALALAWALRARSDRRKAAVEHRALQRLARLHPPALARRLALEPAFLAQPVTLRLGIVFVDIAGFTGLSETLGLTRTQHLLQDFHVLVARVVDARQGVLMNFMGDGALAVFGLPDPAPDDAARALAAALELVRAVQQMPPPMGVQNLDARVGVHIGEVAVSRLGSALHQHVTVTGDGVNLASRLITVAKDAGMRAAASAETLAAAGIGAVPPPDLSLSVAIRGRSAGAEVVAWRLQPDANVLARERAEPTSA